MKAAYTKDIWRTVKKEKKRFFSIMLITALGVAMLCGLRAACEDLRRTADRFYDEQNLYDISVVSTMGLTDGDVAALQNLDKISAAEGTYAEIADISVDGQNKTVQVKTISDAGICVPYVTAGRLPESADEIAVSENYLTESGKAIGDTVTVEERQDDGADANFLYAEYTITASVVDASDVDSHDGTMAFRSTAAADYTFFVEKEAVSSDIYTAVYLTVDGAKELLCYSDEYERLIEDAVSAISENVQEERQQARYDDLTADAKEELADARAEAEEKFAEAEQEIADAKETLEENRSQLVRSAQYLTAEQYAESLAALEAGEAEIAESEQTLAGERETAENGFADAQAEIDAVDMPQWYIQDRSELGGYTNVESDADCIESVGTVFPVLFLVVAVLISLTTVTRMVEEERGLIGTYKALGFTDREIRGKYLVYAALACAAGGILGDIAGFIVLPAIIFYIFGVMYQLPQYFFGFDVLYGVGGALVFALGIVGSSWISCDAELKHTPAALMRPKAPKSGSRIFLERISFFWKRLSFLNKVTARNLFRYKKRMFMTIGGITGCTALVLCGFVIRDSVFALSDGQYEDVYRFDILAATGDDAYDDFLAELAEKDEVADYIRLRVETVKVKSGGDALSVQLFVLPDDADYTGYLCLEDGDGGTVTLSENDGSYGAYVTQNAANVLGFSAGDSVELQDAKLAQEKVSVSGLVRNYMGNIVYMTQSVYEKTFGDYQSNAVLLHVSEDCADEVALKEEIEEMDGVQSAMSIAETVDNFSVSVMIINLVVYIIIIMAAGLALVVLFTLATTNISERERELATIKVLGFYDREVHLYVNKETLILTGIGILLGLPLGNVLGHALTNALNLPSIYFAVEIHPVSYLYAASLSFGFALLVDVLTNRILNRINPVEALKSVE